MQKRFLKIGGALILLAIGVAPIIIYIATFGTAISSDHSRWAEMGSAMAGLYAPALSALTVLLLYNQYRLQSSQHKLQVQLAEHTVTQSVIASRTELVTVHLGKLEKYFTGTNPQAKLVGSGLHIFHNKSNSALLFMNAEAKDLYTRQPILLDSWVGIYTALAGLDKDSSSTIRVLYESLTMRIVSSLSVPIVKAMDNFYFAIKPDPDRKYILNRSGAEEDEI